MKDIISNCEKQFVLQSIRNGKRLDGRELDEFRSLEIEFGSDFGCCYATLGETKVVAQVSWTLNEPRALRPTEGLLFINVDISEAVCSSYDTGHQPHLATHTNRLLEKSIKESNCVDLESLCILAGEQVFDVRVDVTVLNYDGNLLTCCSVGVLSALAHFRLPAVTMENSQVVVYTPSQRPPLPLSLHHFPILVSFAVFCDGETAVVDPTELEEKVSEGELVIGMNNYRELCGLHFSGRAIGNKGLILTSSSRAALIAADCVKRLKATIERDSKSREERRGLSDGLVRSIHLDRILSGSRDRQALRLQPEAVLSVLSKAKVTAGLHRSEMNEGNTEEEESDEDLSPSDEKQDQRHKVKPFAIPDKVGGILVTSMEAPDFGKEWVPSEGKSSWEVSDSKPVEEEEEEEDDDVNYVRTITEEDRIIDKIELSGDSEEEEVLILTGNK